MLPVLRSLFYVMRVCVMLFVSAAVMSVLSVSAVVGITLASIFVLLLIVLIIVLVLCRRHKHFRRSSSTSRRFRLPTFADITSHSEITSFLPTAGSVNGLRGVDFTRPTSAVGQVCRQATDDMPPSYDSVVKTCDIAAVRRRRDSNLTSSTRRSQARLSLPPLSTNVFPPVLRTHRRAESDAEEHIYEDPASLRRSVSGDGLECLLQNSASSATANCREVVEENGGVRPSEVVDQSQLELLLALAPSSVDTQTPVNRTPELVHPLPCSVASNSCVNVPICFSQPRVPRVRLGTSALYCRPDSRIVDWCRSGDFLASANQLQPFSPLSTIGYPELIDSFTRRYQWPGEDFPVVHNASQQHCGDNDAGFELRSHIHSTPSGNQCSHQPTAMSCFRDDLSLFDSQFNHTLSACTSSTESEHYDASQVSPLFDDDNVDNIGLRDDWHCKVVRIIKVFMY